VTGETRKCAACVDGEVPDAPYGWTRCQRCAGSGIDTARTIAWFSAGITSAAACKIALDTYPDVALIYIETGRAHPDNARFIADCERWYGQPIRTVRNTKYADHFDVIAKRRYVNGPGGALCTTVLKKDVRYEVERELAGYDRQVFGMEFSRKEINRAVRFSEQYPAARPVFPLIDAGLTKQDCARMLAAAGIELPAMYRLGFANNNCIGCVKGGKFYWNLVRTHFPTDFDRMAGLEREVGRSCIKGAFLDQLDPLAGRPHEMIEAGECGVFCAVEGADVESPHVERVVRRDVKMGQLDLWAA
jgi:hypothetical protein